MSDQLKLTAEPKKKPATKGKNGKCVKCGRDDMYYGLLCVLCGEADMVARGEITEVNDR